MMHDLRWNQGVGMDQIMDLTGHVQKFQVTSMSQWKLLCSTVWSIRNIYDTKDKVYILRNLLSAETGLYITVFSVAVWKQLERIQGGHRWST